VDPTREPRPEADQGGAVAEQPQQLPLVSGPRVRLRDQSGEEHAGEEPRVHRIAFLRRRRDRPQRLGVGEVKADPGRHEQIVDPGPKGAGFDHHLEGAERREDREQPVGLARGDGGLQRYTSQPVQHRDGDIP